MYRQFILEAKIDDLKKKWVGNLSLSHDIASNHLLNLSDTKENNDSRIISAIHAADPHARKSNTEWMIQSYNRGEYKVEDLPSVKDTLKDFDRFKSALAVGDRDIHKHSLSSMRNAIRPHVEKSIQKSVTINHGADLIHDKDGVKVYHVKTREASCLLGAGMPWCTSHQDPNLNMFDHYTDKGKNPFYIVKLENEKAPNRRLGIQFNHDEFQNENNDHLQHVWNNYTGNSENHLPDLVARNPELKRIPAFQGMKSDLTEHPEYHRDELLINDPEYLKNTKDLTSREIYHIIDNGDSKHHMSLIKNHASKLNLHHKDLLARKSNAVASHLSQNSNIPISDETVDYLVTHKNFAVRRNIMSSHRTDQLSSERKAKIYGEDSLRYEHPLHLNPSDYPEERVEKIRNDPDYMKSFIRDRKSERHKDYIYNNLHLASTDDLKYISDSNKLAVNHQDYDRLIKFAEEGSPRAENDVEKQNTQTQILKKLTHKHNLADHHVDAIVDGLTKPWIQWAPATLDSLTHLTKNINNLKPHHISKIIQIEKQEYHRIPEEDKNGLVVDGYEYIGQPLIRLINNHWNSLTPEHHELLANHEHAIVRRAHAYKLKRNANWSIGGFPLDESKLNRLYNIILG